MEEDFYDDDIFGAEQIDNDASIIEDMEESSESFDETSYDSPNDYLTTYLRNRGIDRSKIRFNNEYGELEEVNFDSLSDEDKLSILESTEQIPITDEEINTLNYLRNNRINLREFAEYTKNQAIKEYLEQNRDINYKVDDISDDVLFMSDLKDRYPDLTEEELLDELEQAKVNESLYTKKIQSLRKEYRELEANKQEEDRKIAARQAEDNYRQLAQSFVNVAHNINELHGMVVEDDDKREILSFLLDRDVNGHSQFYKLFEDPESLFKMAWYMKYGDQAFETMQNYYKNVIAQNRRNAGTSRVYKRKTKEPDPYGLEGVF